MNREEQIQINIRVSWAISNATEVATAFAVKESEPEKVKEGIGKWAKWYMELFEHLRHEEAARITDNKDGEQAL